MTDIKVKKEDLEYMTTFNCRHYEAPDNCYNHLEQGGVCNSCWIKYWALEQLKRLEV